MCWWSWYWWAEYAKHTHYPLEDSCLRPGTCKTAAPQSYSKLLNKNWAGSGTAESSCRESGATELPRASGQPCQLLKSGEALGKEPALQRSHLSGELLFSVEAVALTDALMVSSASSVWGITLHSWGMGVQISPSWGGLGSGWQDKVWEGFHCGKEELLAGTLPLCMGRGCAPSVQQRSWFYFPVKRGHWLCFMIHCELIFMLRNLSFNIACYVSIKFIRCLTSKVKTSSTAWIWHKSDWFLL